MGMIQLNLEELLSKEINSISGRTTGQQYAEEKQILNLIDSNDFKIVISPKVKAINDSFIKGFFSEIFRKYKSKEKVQEKFSIEADPYFIELFKKNYSILESINK